MPTVSVPALFAVQQAAQQGDRKVLTLEFEDAQLNTVLYMEGTEVLTVRNALVPSWHTSLLRVGVPSRALAEAHRGSHTLFATVQHLLNTGNLSVGDLARVAHERLVSALVPLYWHMTAVGTKLGHVDDPEDFVTRTSTPSALTEAGWYALTLSPDQRALRPSDRFGAPLARLVDHPHTSLGMTWSNAQRGLSLGQIARRLPLRWDVLTGHVTELMAEQLLKPQGNGYFSPAENVGGSLGVHRPKFRSA